MPNDWTSPNGQGDGAFGLGGNPRGASRGGRNVTPRTASGDPLSVLMPASTGNIGSGDWWTTGQGEEVDNPNDDGNDHGR